MSSKYYRTFPAAKISTTELHTLKANGLLDGPADEETFLAVRIPAIEPHILKVQAYLKANGLLDGTADEEAFGILAMGFYLGLIRHGDDIRPRLFKTPEGVRMRQLLDTLFQPEFLPLT